MTSQIVSLIVVGIIVAYFLKREKAKSDEYFGKPKKYSKKELAILEYYKSIYKPIPDTEKLPSLENDGFELEDIALTATQIIYDNPIPTILEIEKISKGDLVKLIFVDNEGNAERMWVEIVENFKGQFFKGLLRNDAFESDGLRDGKPVRFHSNHIFDIDHRMRH